MNNIFVQDNFFSEEILTKVQTDIMTSELEARYKVHGNNPYNKNYHFKDLHKDHMLCDVIKEGIGNFFNFKNVKNMNTAYFLSFPNSPAIPHNDADYEYNCLIFVMGDTLINNGTGFYEYGKNEFVLHSHVGFKPNRAVFFDSTIIHSPLQFAGNSTPRYIITNFINEKSKE